MTTAVILAAGAGRKLWPLSETHPKAVLPIANQALIDRLAAACAMIGIGRTVIVAGDNAAAIERAVGHRPGVEIEARADRAGPAWSLRRLVASHGLDDDLLILHGDLFFEVEDLRALLEAGEQGPAVLLSLLDQRTIDPRLPVERSQDWIGAAVENDRLVRFLGHHRAPLPVRSTGAFVLPAGCHRALHGIGTRFDGVGVGSMPPDEVPLEQVFNDLVLAGKTVRAVVCRRPFVDVDKPWHLLIANDCAVRAVTGAISGRDLSPDATVDPAARIGGRLRLGRRSRIEGPVIVDGDLWAGDDVIISDGAIVRGPLVVGDRTRLTEYCHILGPSSIGPDCTVAHAAEFRGLAMEHVNLFHFMEIYGVVGSCANIGAGTVCGTLRFDDRPQPQRIAGRPEVPNDHASACMIGAYSRTGVNAILSPGVRIGPYSAVGPGVLVSEDVPSRTLLTLRQELERRPWGPDRHGW
jgi:NDP-sugar pyrophosphorylase family protein